MEEAPNMLYADCPECGEVTLQEVLTGRRGKSSLDATLRCQECQRVHSAQLRQPEELERPVIISDGKESFRSKTILESDDLLVVGDEFFVDDVYVRITDLELGGGKRVNKAPAPEIQTIWAKRFDKLRLKVSINNVHRTYARHVEALPDEEFTVGDILRFGVDETVIHGIKTHNRMLRRGSAEARDIVRMYGKIMRRTYR